MKACARAALLVLVLVLAPSGCSGGSDPSPVATSADTTTTVDFTESCVDDLLPIVVLGLEARVNPTSDGGMVDTMTAELGGAGPELSAVVAAAQAMGDPVRDPGWRDDLSPARRSLRKWCIQTYG